MSPAIELTKGQLVYRTRPWVYALCSGERTRRCEFCLCLLTAKQRISCKHCGYVYYCSDKCLDESLASGWHRVECGTTATRPLRNMTRLVARVLVRLDPMTTSIPEHTGAMTSECIYGHKRDWNCLMDHYDDVIRDPCAMFTFQAIYDELELVFGEHQLARLATVHQLVSIYGKLLVNSFAINEEHSWRQIARALYLGPSILDHSCRPDIYYRFDGLELSLIAARDLSIDDIRQCFICYVDELDSVHDRQRQLREAFYFDCACVRCVEDLARKTPCQSELQSVCEKIDDYYTSNSVAQLTQFAFEYCLSPEVKSQNESRRLTKDFESLTGSSTQPSPSLPPLDPQVYQTPSFGQLCQEDRCQLLYRLCQPHWPTIETKLCQPETLTNGEFKVLDLVACYLQDASLVDLLAEQLSRYYGLEHPRFHFNLWRWIGVLLVRLFQVLNESEQVEQVKPLACTIIKLYRQAKSIHQFLTEPTQPQSNKFYQRTFSERLLQMQVDEYAQVTNREGSFLMRQESDTRKR